jgi:hypothetical protein
MCKGAKGSLLILEPRYQWQGDFLKENSLVNLLLRGFKKGPVWKDPTVEMNCIPPWLNTWYRVICISGIGGIGALLVVFFINNIYDFFTSIFSFPTGGMAEYFSNFKNEKFHFKIVLLTLT